MSHEPSGFLSGSFRGSQFNRPVVDKERHAIVATPKRYLDNLMWTGAKSSCDLRIVTYIFHPEACASVTKATTGRLACRRTFLSQYPIATMHIASERNS